MLRLPAWFGVHHFHFHVLDFRLIKPDLDTGTDLEGVASICVEMDK
jgi:hypothetical protein